MTNKGILPWKWPSFNKQFSCTQVSHTPTTLTKFHSFSPCCDYSLNLPIVHMVFIPSQETITLKNYHFFLQKSTGTESSTCSPFYSIFFPIALRIELITSCMPGKHPTIEPQPQLISSLNILWFSNFI